MARATTGRSRTVRRVVSKAPRAVEDTRPDDILRRFEDEIIENPVRWMLIGFGIGYLYGRFKR